MTKKINMLSILKMLALLLAVVLCLPYLNIVMLALKPNSKYLNFIIEHGILWKYTYNTIELIVKVGIFSSVLGFFGAYFMAFYSFKFKKIINLFFILPLSIPIYVGAYVYSDLYHRIPILEHLFKNDFTMNSAVFIYVIFLYPYVYLTTYAYLKKYMQEYVEAGQMLNLSNNKILYRIIFPLTKSILFSSSLFVIYESLSDFAVSEYFGIQTLSRAFNDAWRVSSDQSTSAKLALFLLLIIVLAISVEKLLRKRGKVDGQSGSDSRLVKAEGKTKVLIYSFFLLVISIGFLLPFQRILIGAIRNYEYFFKRNIIDVTIQTFVLSLWVVLFILIVGMFLSFILKYLKASNQKKLSLVSTLGYMMPSMILSLGVYSLFFNIDVFINPLVKSFHSKGYILTSTSLVLVVGLSLKFLAIAFNNFEQTYRKINPNIFEASLTLNQNPIKTFFKVDLYFLSKTSIFIIILVILDVFKELTLSFSLSPFNFRTVSMEIYHYMANEMQQVAYVPSIIIVFVCIICILALERGLINDKDRELDL